ncbi:PDZ domain-containing protein [Paenibacillus senegalensis]|uniref:PDZ domain-containing protein n=1 Tax=Paenibacillus senegalensis TaxID=1465766 RepID=UPI00028A2EF3|nr:PDZ domain-containing protein [Paenibacillus senegalensis]
MRRRHLVYILGMAMAIFLFIAGELIWLLDPIRLGGQLFWIDVIDFLVYVIAVVPLIWIAAGWWGLTAARRQWKQAGRPSGFKAIAPQLRKGAVMLFSFITIISIVVGPLRIVLAVVVLGISWLLVFLDMFFDEREVRKTPARSLISLGVTGLLLVCLFMPTPYMVSYPGLTMDMSRYGQAKGGARHGNIAGVLVFQRPAFPVDWLYARFFPHYTFERTEQLGMNISSYSDLVRQMKLDANTVGTAVAYNRLGLGEGVIPQGVRVMEILQESSVKDLLRPGDVIIGLNGNVLTSVKEFNEQMTQLIPGNEASVTLVRDGQKITLTAESRSNEEDPTRAMFGIAIQDDLEYDIPGTVSFHRYLVHEGGPSHGAMLALALIDQLTPGGVTYGNTVAGTGTIRPDGTIGPVGGVRQKAYTVYRTGVDVFFVPEGAEEAARSGAPRLNVVPVKTLDDILNWLKENPRT